MLLSGVQKCESAIHKHISPYPFPLAPPSHHPYPSPLGGHKAPSWSPCAMLLLPTIYFTFDSIYKSMPLSHFVPAYSSHSPCPQVHSLHLCLYSCPVPRFSWFLTSLPWQFNDGKNSVFNKYAGTTSYPHSKNKVEPLPHTIYKNELKLDLNVITKRIKLLEENIDVKL